MDTLGQAVIVLTLCIAAGFAITAVVPPNVHPLAVVIAGIAIGTVWAKIL